MAAAQSAVFTSGGGPRPFWVNKPYTAQRVIGQKRGGGGGTDFRGRNRGANGDSGSQVQRRVPPEGGWQGVACRSPLRSDVCSKPATRAGPPRQRSPRYIIVHPTAKPSRREVPRVLHGGCRQRGRPPRIERARAGRSSGAMLRNPLQRSVARDDDRQHRTDRPAPEAARQDRHPLGSDAYNDRHRRHLPDLEAREPTRRSRPRAPKAWLEEQGEEFDILTLLEQGRE